MCACVYMCMFLCVCSFVVSCICDYGLYLKVFENNVLENIYLFVKIWFL